MKIKIAIVGLGGVGGYFGGMLAKHYANNPEIEIYFVARGAHLKRVQENGLTLITEKGTFQVFPTLATDNVTEIGTADYIILTSKSYDLDNTVEQIKPLISANTIILPLLNGIDNSEHIRTLLPKVEVWDGCCYIVAKIKDLGVVENAGNIHKIVFGFQNHLSKRLMVFEEMLQRAGIEAQYFENILNEIWKKFFFISTSASLTSYFNVSYNEILTDTERRQTLIDISTELIKVAYAEGIVLENSEIEKLIYQFEKLPVGTTTSMHRDFQTGKNTEVDSLTGIVLKLGRKHGISTATYKKVYEELKEKRNDG